MQKEKTLPTFDECMEFNEQVWPLFRIFFADGKFTKKEALEFLNKDRKNKNKNNYVRFIKIPKKLMEVVTPEHAYLVREKREGETNLYLDNDYSHWVKDVYLTNIDPDDLDWRLSYDKTRRFRGLKQNMLVED